MGIVKRNISKEWFSLFSMDSKVTKAFEKLYFLFVTNILFIFTAMPIITIGIAQTALYSSILKMREEPEAQPMSTYFNNMKTYWKSGLVIGISELIVGGIILFELMLLKAQFGNTAFVIKSLCIGFAFIISIIYIYIVPISLRKKEKYINMFKDSFLISCLYAPWSLAILSLLFIIVQLFQLNGLTTMMVISFFVVLGFSSFTYVQSIIVERILNKEVK